MTSQQERERGQWLRHLAQLHRDKWQTTGDIKLLKIAHDLDIEAKHWAIR
jgi:hypothetical protein